MPILPGINPSNTGIQSNGVEGNEGELDNICCGEISDPTSSGGGSWAIGGVMPYLYPPIKITGNYTSANQRDILLNMGILLDGKYRENVMDEGTYKFTEKYTRTNSGNK